MLSKNIKVRINRIKSGLSKSYNFFYVFFLNKRVKKTLFIIIILYLIFISWIIYRIYNKDSLDGIIENVFPFFIDAFLVTLFTIFILFIRAFINDEGNRLKRNRYENISDRYIFTNENDIKNFNIYLNENFYKMPEIIDVVLKWVPFDKDDYFMINYGSLDIPKISLKQLKLKDNNINIECSLTSFYDVVFTHYFADYIISDLSTTEEKKLITIRNLLEDTLKNYYDNLIKARSSDLDITMNKLLPNPLGITGILKYSFENEEYFLVKMRHSTEAASRNRLQWSFAGTLDVLPYIYNRHSNYKIDFEDLFMEELFDEVLKKLNKNLLFKDLVKIKKEIDYKFLGYTLNPLYLFQPEFFVYINLNDLNEKIHLNIKNKKFYKNFEDLKKINLKEADLIFIKKDLILEKKDVIFKENKFNGISTRGLFSVGLKLLVNKGLI